MGSVATAGSLDVASCRDGASSRDGAAGPVDPAEGRVTLRPVRPEDEPFLRRLHRSTRDDLTTLSGLDVGQLQTLLDLQFRAQADGYRRQFPGAAHDLVVVDGEPAGRLWVDRSTATHLVIDIALLPEHRDRGVGTALLQRVQAQAAADAARVRLQARRGSPAARLYRRLGFLPVEGADANSAADRPAPAGDHVPLDHWRAPGGGDAPAMDDVELEWRAEHWLPIQVVAGRPDPWVEWFDAGTGRLADPFFVQAFQRAQHRQATAAPPGRRWRRRTPLVDLLAEAARAAGPAPAGFVFHMGRCGSTLLARMLGADPDHLVLSEPPAVDGVLRTRWTSGLGEDEDQRVAALRGVLGVLGRPRHGERRLFVKFDAWHATMIPVLLQAFPGTPWVFLHRDPVEVLVSLERSVPAFVVPGGAPSAAFGLDAAAAGRLGADDYAAAVVAAICQAGGAALAQQPGGMAVAYADLPDALGAVLHHFGVAVDRARLAAMTAVSRFDAKAPDLPFVPDGPAKQAMADEALRRRAAAVAGPTGPTGPTGPIRSGGRADLARTGTGV